MKKILTLLLWLGGSVAFGQSINGVSPTVIGIDGSNTTAAKVLTLPQVQATLTYNASATPSPVVPQPTQASSWFQMNGNGAALVEFSTNGYTGNYSIQVSDNPTPVSTPGTNIETAVADTTVVAGGTNTQTKMWDYVIREGHKWIRFIAQPDALTNINTGTLNTQIRLFGNPVAGDAARAYTSGVPWKSIDSLAAVGSAGVTGTTYYEYKLPQGAHGFNLYTNVASLNGASTVVSTVYQKDPFTGILQSIGVATTSAGVTGMFTVRVSPGYASPYPVATPPTGQTIISTNVAQDLVIGNFFSGAGTMTYSQDAVPVQ